MEKLYNKIQMQRLLENLKSERQRAVIAYLWLEGLSEELTASELDLTVRQVKKAEENALLRLRQLARSGKIKPPPLLK